MTLFISGDISSGDLDFNTVWALIGGTNPGDVFKQAYVLRDTATMQTNLDFFKRELASGPADWIKGINVSGWQEVIDAIRNQQTIPRESFEFVGNTIVDDFLVSGENVFGNVESITTTPLQQSLTASVVSTPTPQNNLLLIALIGGALLLFLKK